MPGNKRQVYYVMFQINAPGFNEGSGVYQLRSVLGADRGCKQTPLFDRHSLTSLGPGSYLVGNRAKKQYYPIFSTKEPGPRQDAIKGKISYSWPSCMKDLTPDISANVRRSA